MIPKDQMAKFVKHVATQTLAVGINVSDYARIRRIDPTMPEIKGRWPVQCPNCGEPMLIGPKLAEMMKRDDEKYMVSCAKCVVLTMKRQGISLEDCQFVLAGNAENYVEEGD